jgi:O-antigen ligase
MKQFFGKTTWIALSAVAALYVCAGIGFGTNLSPIILSIIGLGSAVLAFKKLDWGLGLVFLELFSNPHGILLATEVSGVNVSLRMTIFAGVMAGWFIGLLAKQHKLTLKNTGWEMFVPLVFAIVIGWTVGLMSRSFSEVFSDGNAYLYLAYILPIISVKWDDLKRMQLLQVLTASALWIAGLSLVLLFMFTHITGDLISLTYTFFRDLRVAEITLLDGGAWRVFIQSQAFVIIFGFFLAAMTVKQKQWKLLLVGGLVYSTILLGLSRSFWVGLAPTVIVAAIMLWNAHKPTFKRAMKYVGLHLGALVAGVAMILIAAMFPMPGLDVSSDGLLGSFVDRTTESNDVAVSSRWNLLDPMMEAIKDQPVLGHGFGKAVTYITDDPRAREINPSGEWTVVAMEWGWLELWIKMGVMGVVGFLYLAYGYIRRLWAYQSTAHAWIGTALTAMIMFIYATHVFSPYLNHPIGLGILLFVVPFLPNKKQAEAISTVSVKNVNAPMRSSAVAASESS